MQCENFHACTTVFVSVIKINCSIFFYQYLLVVVVVFSRAAGTVMSEDWKAEVEQKDFLFQLALLSLLG